MKDAVMNLSFNMTDAKPFVRKGANGGFKLGFVVFAKKQKDDYGNDLSVRLDLPEEERKALHAPIYLGDGVYIDFTKKEDAPWQNPLPGKFVRGILELSGISKYQYRPHEKSGKVFLSITIAGRKEAARNGDTLSVYVSQTKTEREEKVEKTYCGGARFILFNEKLEDLPTVSVDEQMPWEGISTYSGVNAPVSGTSVDDTPGNDDLPF